MNATHRNRRSASRSSASFDDPSEPAAILEDSLLEPYPDLTVCSSFSEVLNSPSSANTTISSAAATGRPSRALTMQSVPEETWSPMSVGKGVKGICEIPSNQVGITPKLACSSLSAVKVDEVNCQLRSISAATNLATEIIQHIMYNLSPPDFNSARHTCRSWYISSLNHILLETMLRRSGFSASVRPSGIFRPHPENVSDEWLMSKRLSRECALGPDWAGNGTLRRPDAISEFAKSPFVRISTTDFTEVAVNYPGPNSCGTIFTASSCGKFLMAANGCLVYVYQLNQSHETKHPHKSNGNSRATKPGALRPVATIICPRQVLACSMDTSSHRYAIAILLDGRMCLVSEISILNEAHPAACSSRNGQGSPPKRQTIGAPVLPGDLSRTSELQGTSFLDRISLNSSCANPERSRAPSDIPFVFLGIATAGATFAPVDQLAFGEGNLKLHSSAWRAEKEVSPEPKSYGVPIENGPRSLYYNLCSEDDSPRSVAICPQRRCVAFGCSSGIELHWVDALTGQDLNRWFPLTAPSDFLYFLPPRKSIDSAKKLRLISSAAKPNERSAIAQRPFGGRTRSSPFWENSGVGVNQITQADLGGSQGLLARLKGDNLRGSLTGPLDCSDHYRAIPLSDGYHILFTDPATGLLCLGSDAPVGGPTKLLRKIWFQGPPGQGSPVAYVGGSDLRWGVRVVAAFGVGAQQTIWLFSVPPDIFTANSQGNPNSSMSQWLGVRSNYRDGKNLDWVNWWEDDGLQEWLSHVLDPVPGVLPRSVWPVKIRGQKIGSCNGVVDLALDAGPKMTVWAFSRHGIGKVWKIDDGYYGLSRRRWVMRDGTVRESEGEGDAEMDEATPAMIDDLNATMASDTLTQDKMRLLSCRVVEPPTTASFDGSSSSRAAGTYHSPSFHDSGFDDAMVDEPPPDFFSGEKQDLLVEPVTELTHGQLSYQRQSWSRHGQGVTDIMEAPTGFARIDVKIK